MAAKRLLVLLLLMYGILAVPLFIGCAKREIDPAGIYLVAGGQAYIEMVRDASDNLVIKEISLFPDHEEVQITRRVFFEGQKLILLIEYTEKMPDEAKWFRLYKFEPWKYSIYFELLASSAAPGDWDMVGKYEWRGLSKDMPSEEEIPKDEYRAPSYLHRVDDKRVVEYFDLVADYPEPEGFGPASEPQPDVDRLLGLSAELVKSHPKDLYVRTLYLDALLRKRDYETLQSRLSAWRKAYVKANDPLLSYVRRRADGTLRAIQLSTADRNAYDLVIKLFGPDTDLATRLELFPHILDYEEYAFPRSSLILRRINLIPYKIPMNVLRIEALFLMLEGKRHEALKILAASFHLGKLMNRSDTMTGRLVGTEVRSISCEGMELYALNCCETADEFQVLWKTLEELNQASQAKGVAELFPLPTAKTQIESETSCHNSDAEFQLIRMATAAKYRFTTQSAFPRNGAEFAPLLPDGPPQDPFTTGPLRFFSSSDTFTCYSIGPDKQDDRASVSYDPTNGTSSGGDIIVEIPHEREYPFPRDGVRAASADELRKQFPNGLPADPFADTRGRPLGISNTTPVYVYSYGPDTDESEARKVGDRYAPEVLYDPTNGTISPGDLFIAIPR